MSDPIDTSTSNKTSIRTCGLNYTEEWKMSDTDKDKISYKKNRKTSTVVKDINTTCNLDKVTNVSELNQGVAAYPVFENGKYFELQERLVLATPNLCGKRAVISEDGNYRVNRKTLVNTKGEYAFLYNDICY